MMKKLGLCASGLAIALAGTGLFAAPGKNTANFLKVDVGGKAVAMAGTQYASENDSFAQFYNPSLLAGLSRREAGFMHNEFIDDLRQEVFTYAHPTPRFGTFAGALNYFTYGQIEGFDKNGARTGTLSARDILISGSWAKTWKLVLGERVVEGLSTGATLKILSRKLADESASGFALDLGANYPLKGKYLDGLKIAGAVQNLGPGIKFKGESSPLPQTVRIGLSRAWFGEALTADFDEVLQFGSGAYPALALQYKVLNMFHLRVGYKAAKDLDQKLTYGVGFENPIFRVDYAFVPFGDVGDTHRVSVIYRFGKTSRLATADDQLKTKVKQAKTLYGQGLLVDAFMICFQIQRVAPWLEENNKFLAKIQQDFKELEAGDQKEKLVQQATALFNRAEAFFEAGNLLDARTEFQAVLVLQPDNKAAQGYLNHIESQFLSFVESFYRAGMIAFAEENYEKAKEQFEKVLTIKPDHAESQAQLARCVEMLEAKVKKEKEELQKFMAEKNYLSAMEAFQKENYEESYRLFGEVVNISPDHEDAKRNMELSKTKLYESNLETGRNAAGAGNWEAAISHLRKAVEVNDTHEAKSALADAQRRWELQKKVLSQNLYKEGLEAFLSGDKAKAQSVWKRAVELDSDNEEAKRGLQRLTQ